MGLFFVLKSKLKAEQDAHNKTIDILNAVSEVRAQKADRITACCNELACPETVLVDSCRKLMSERDNLRLKNAELSIKILATEGTYTRMQDDWSKTQKANADLLARLKKLTKTPKKKLAKKKR